MSAARPRLSEPRGLAHPTVAEGLIALLNGTLTARGQ